MWSLEYIDPYFMSVWREGDQFMVWVAVWFLPSYFYLLGLLRPARSVSLHWRLLMMRVVLPESGSLKTTNIQSDTTLDSHFFMSCKLASFIFWCSHEFHQLTKSSYCRLYCIFEYEMLYLQVGKATDFSLIPSRVVWVKFWSDPDTRGRLRAPQTPSCSLLICWFRFSACSSLSS